MSSSRYIPGMFAVILGGGFGMWALVSPEEERKTRIKHLPMSDPSRREEVRRMNALTMQVLKDAAKSKDNIARGVGGSRD